MDTYYERDTCLATLARSRIFLPRSIHHEELHVNEFEPRIVSPESNSIMAAHLCARRVLSRSDIGRNHLPASSWFTARDSTATSGYVACLPFAYFWTMRTPILRLERVAPNGNETERARQWKMDECGKNIRDRANLAKQVSRS